MTHERVLRLIVEACEKNLTTLDLSANQLTKIPSEIGELKNLKELDLSHNQLIELPPQIVELKNLTTLNLYGNQLNQLPPEIGELENLTKLDLYGNQLSQLPSEIKELKNLTTLNLTGNRLNQLPPEIGELKNLTTLNLYGNYLNQLPPEIGELENLTKLDLYGNQLNQLPQEIKELKNLTTLNLTGNQLSQLPQEIKELKNLTTLNLTGNQLSQLPPEIKELKNLTTLNLTGNQLSQLPPEIKELKNLIELYLARNQLNQLPPEIGELKNLTTLNVSRNQLNQLPPEIGELKNIEIIYLNNNPLTSPPPEIVSRGLEAVLTFLKLSQSIENNEAKIIFVGNGDVGKTCLAYRLINDKFLEDSKTTEGINISKWKISAPSSKSSEIKLNVWDFGGQEIYRATHQFFLTKRSVYLLVWNARKENDYDHIYYWLYTIEAFGGDSPIILVMSKVNEYDDDLNLKDLKSRFPQIVGYVKIDSYDGRGINSLIDFICRTAWDLPLMRTKWTDSWFKVRQKLEDLGENWITYDKFLEICKSEGLDNENINVLDDYLNDLGVTLHFKDRLTLKNIVILKPEWATEAFYKILASESVRNNEGILPQSELIKIWDMETYPPSVYPQLMDLMNKFELAYELPDEPSDEKYYLVPQLLPKVTPDFEWDNTDNLCFYYNYDYLLPFGIITRFIVRMHQNIEKKETGLPLCWREGVVLQLQNSRALIKVRQDKREIEIRIKGNNKRGALGAICNQLDYINATIKKINVSKKIPCNCSENCLEIFPYEDLLIANAKGIETVPCFKSFKNISIKSLLDGYREKEKNSEVYSGQHGNTYINAYGGELNLSKDTVRINNIGGSVNVKSQLNHVEQISQLDHVEQIVMNAPAIADIQKKEFAALIEELKQALGSAASAKSNDTERIIEDAGRVAREISREKPNKSRLISITEDLKETAKAVENIAPLVLKVVTKISAFVNGIF